jgi:hypothetical protein
LGVGSLQEEAKSAGRRGWWPFGGHRKAGPAGGPRKAGTAARGAADEKEEKPEEEEEEEDEGEISDDDLVASTVGFQMSPQAAGTLLPVFFKKMF